MFVGKPWCFSVRWLALISERCAVLGEVAVRFPTVRTSGEFMQQFKMVLRHHITGRYPVNMKFRYFIVSAGVMGES